MARPKNLADLQRAAGGLAPESRGAASADKKKGTAVYSRDRINLPKRHAWARRQFPWRPIFITIGVVLGLLAAGSFYLMMSQQKLVPLHFVTETGTVYYLAVDGGLEFIMRRIPTEGIEANTPWWKFETKWYKENPDTHWEVPGFEWHVEQMLHDVYHSSTNEIYATPVQWRGRIHPWLFMSLTALAALLVITKAGRKTGKPHKV